MRERITRAGVRTIIILASTDFGILITKTTSVIAFIVINTRVTEGNIVAFLVITGITRAVVRTNSVSACSVLIALVNVLAFETGFTQADITFTLGGTSSMRGTCMDTGGAFVVI